MLTNDNHENNQVAFSVFNFWFRIKNFFSGLWARLSGTYSQSAPSTTLETAPFIPLNIDSARFASLNAAPEPFVRWSLNPDVTVIGSPTLLESIQEDIPSLVRMHNFRSQNFFNHEAYFPDRNFHREEELRTWFHNERPMPRKASESELVELEETQNARKLDPYPNIQIDDRFICGITHEIMTHPIYDRNNPHQKMDYRALLTWLKEKKTHPFTRSQLNIKDLAYDEALKMEIDQFVQETQERLEMPTPSYS